jgi:Glycosyl hydrolases family 15
MRFVEDNWNTPDDGIWEVRGSFGHFNHSKRCSRTDSIGRYPKIACMAAGKITK